VLSDSEFRCADRNKKFLRYISEELFAGRESGLKAYTIAVDVFGRPPNFDPSSDPIVRIEATRLRAALIRYYESRQMAGGIVISLAKGHYVPEFTRASGEQPVESVPAPAAAFHAWKPEFSYRRAGIACAVLLAALAIAGLGLLQTDAATFTEMPSVSIAFASSGGPDDSRWMAMKDSLMIALSSFDTLRLSTPDTYTASTEAGRPGDEARPRHGHYQILLKHRFDGKRDLVWWQLTDQEDGEALRSGEEWAPADNPDPAAADKNLVSKLAIRFASFRGVINTIEIARELDAPSLGNGCVIRARLAVLTADQELMGNSRSCLEETLRLKPYDADAHATLAELLLAADPVDAPTVLTKYAEEHAAEAVAMAPESDRSHYAKMQASLRSGNVEAAKRAGKRAVELNPYNTFIAARYASMLFSLGDWNEAVPLALDAARSDATPQPDAQRTLAFDAYRRGAFGEAVQMLQAADSHCYLARLLLAAALAQSGREREAASAVAEIRQTRPGFENSFQTDMAKRHITPELVAALGEGLKRAGSKIATEPPAIAAPSPEPEKAPAEGL
jgi:thioredoxin-like negative regulator of GroEL